MRRRRPAGPKVSSVTPEDQPADGFAARMAFALQKDPNEGARRTHLHLKLLAITLTWLVTVPILLIFGLTGGQRGDTIFDWAAFLTILGPFVAAVTATKNRRPGLGGAFVVLTLLMTLPALAIVRF